MAALPSELRQKGLPSPGVFSLKESLKKGGVPTISRTSRINLLPSFSVERSQDAVLRILMSDNNAKRSFKRNLTLDTEPDSRFLNRASNETIPDVVS